MKAEISIVDRNVDGQRVRMVKVVDSLKPRRVGYAPVADDTDQAQVEAAVLVALENLRQKRKSST
jgi:hypothetical protein